MGAILEIKYFNSFWTKKLETGSGINSGTFPGPVEFGDTVSGLGNNNLNETGPSGSEDNFWEYGGNVIKNRLRSNFYIEESRIRGGFGNATVDFGVRAYLDEEVNAQERRFNSLIYSGVYNSRTGANDTNVFSIGENITRSLDPASGSIQRLYAEDTNLLIFQENKVNRALIDKDVTYTSEGGTQTLPPGVVIGQIVPYLGEFGISQNPESFGVYGFQKYFTDKDRNVVLRLSRDGITPISNYGMTSYFRDELRKIDNDFKNYYVTATRSKAFAGDYFSINVVTSSIRGGEGETGNLQIGSGFQFSTDGISFFPSVPDAYIVDIESPAPGNPTQTQITLSKKVTLDVQTIMRFVSPDRGRANGGYDVHSKDYLLSMQKNSTFTSNDTSTYQTLNFNESINGWTSRFSFKPTKIFSVENALFTINIKDLYLHYDNVTANRRGFWYEQPYNSASVTFIFNKSPLISKNFNTVSYEGNSGWEIKSFDGDVEGEDFMETINNQNIYNSFQDKTNVVYSYLEGRYESHTPNNTGLLATQPPYEYAGFNRKENKYMAALVQKQTDSNYPPRPGEVIFGNKMSGIKGYFATVQISTDSITEIGSEKEIFSVASNFIQTS
jgi:hypothetical protein